MADITVFFYDGVIRETPEHIELPAPTVEIGDFPSITEAVTAVEMMVALAETHSAAVALDGLFFFGATTTPGGMQIIHTPASMAFFDEHLEGWRHQIALPITSN